MSNSLQLIAGLGNPGPDYENTRHNAGAQFVEELARDNGISLSTDSKFHGLCGRGIVAGREVRLLIPTTFMNRSGQAVAAAMRFYKLEPADLLVAHDELDLPPGVARYKTGGGHGGHNGLRDIISALGNNRDFHRLRLGIGHPGHSDKVVSYVLNKPPASEHELISASIQEAIRSLPDAMDGNWAKAMNQLHRFNGSVSP